MNKKYLDQLISTLLKIDTSKEMEAFLNSILTPKERAEIPVRLEIVKRLKEGYSQHKIAQDLGVGIATVTRGSKELQQGNFKILD